jgi:hypothetical protein
MAPVNELVRLLQIRSPAFRGLLLLVCGSALVTPGVALAVFDACVSANGNPYRRAPEKFIDRKLSPRMQWIDFELRANLQQYKRTDSEVEVPWVWLPADEVIAKPLTQAGNKILKSLTDGDRIRIPKHPFNTESSVPLFSEKPSGTISGHLTASRSIYLPASELGTEATVKLSTNRPFAKKQWWNPSQGKEKVKAVGFKWIKQEAKVSQYLLSIRELRLPQFKAEQNFLPEALSLSFDQNGIISFRDLSAMKPDHQYIPGTSTLFVLREMTDDFMSLMFQTYVLPKARDDVAYFLDDGLVRDNASPQNLLIELDSQFKPTFRLLLRDLGDQGVSKLHADIFRQLGVNVPDFQESHMTADFENMAEQTFMNFMISLHDGDAPYMLTHEEMKGLQEGYLNVFLSEWNQRMGTHWKNLKEVSESVFSKEFSSSLRVHLERLYGKKRT